MNFKSNETVCPICLRPSGGEMQDHHLKPKTFKTRNKYVHERENLIRIHKICHQKIHATFSEKELYDYYHTAERIREHVQIIKFVKWVQKKEPEYYDKNKDTKHRKNRRNG